MDPVTFHLTDGFTLSVGNTHRLVEVPRLSFRNAKKVLGRLAKMAADDKLGELKVVAAARKANVTVSKAGFDELAKVIREIVPRLIDGKNSDVIADLVKLASVDTITEKDLDNMQYNEVADALKYLLDQNFASLKNLSASLQAIDMSGQQAAQ